MKSTKAVCKKVANGKDRYMQTAAETYQNTDHAQEVERDVRQESRCRES